jgi:hypothetical protein
MVALICFVLAVLALPFKSKSRVCTENLDPGVVMMSPPSIACELMIPVR